MSTTLKHPSGRHATAQSRRRTLHGRSMTRASTCAVSASYDVDVEPMPLRTPNSGPSRFGGGPPPPPPPPPPKPPLQPLSRREALFGLLGLGMGVAGTYTYDNRPLDKAEVDERLTEMLDEILDDEALLNTIGQEIFLNKQLEEQDATMELYKGLQAIEAELDKVKTVEDLQAEAEKK